MDEKLKVIISAETAELKEGCKKAVDEIKKVSKASSEVENALSKLQKTIGDQKKELDKLNQEYKNAILEKGKDSKAAKELKEKIKALSTELNTNEKKLNSAEKEAKKLSDSFKKANISAKELKDGFQKAGDTAKKGLKVAAGAITGVITALVATGPATKEFREGQAKLATAFENAGGSAKEAKETYNDLYRVLGDSDVAVEASNHLAKLTTNQQELSEWTNICQGVYATFGDSLPIEGLTEAANETAKTGSLTGGLADALNWAGVNEEEFQAKLDACNTEAEREATIRETLNGLYSDASAKYEENAEAILAQNEANASMEESMALIGEAMTPINTMLTELGSEILADLAPHITEFADNHGPAIKDALDGIGDAVGTVMNFIADNWDVIAPMAGIITGIAVALGVLSTAIGIVNTLMATSPTTWIILGIVAAVAALVAIIVVCAKHWDEIKAKVAEVVEKIKTKVQEMKDKVSEKFENMKTAIDEKIEGIKTKVKDKFESIKQTIADKIEGAKEKVHNAIEKIKGFFNFKWELPKIKLPHFSVTGKFSLKPPQIPHFSVSWYQNGGVFDKPTLFGYGGNLGGLGENGAEAVVPLEKNTQWLDKIAARLAGSQSNRPIILQVDGKTFGEIAVDSINNLTRQSGKLSLVVY